MDWTKIKTKHYLYSDFTLAEKGALSTLLCLVAHLEKIPTEKDMLRHVPKGTLTTLRRKLDDCSTTLREVLDKVFDDVEKVVQSRELNRKRVEKHRVKKDCNALHDNDCNATDKIRGDEIRRDDIILTSSEDEKINNSQLDLIPEQNKNNNLTIYPKEMQLAELLHNKILTVLPNRKAPNLNNWAKEIDLMIRIDKRTKEEIKYVIEWLYAGSEQGLWWQSKILSTSNLRKHFDRLLMQIKGEKTNAKHGSNGRNEGICKELERFLGETS